MRRTCLLLLALLLLFSTTAGAAKRRAVRPPSNPDVIGPDPNTVAGWLAIHGHTLSTPEFFTTGTAELAPLRGMIGDAEVVGLGDSTHGTHEFYTVKHRVIDFLVREMNFDAVVIEGPVALVARLNEYVLGGDADPRPVLAQTMASPLFYTFWNNEEFLAVVEWMREYNATRGDRTPVQIFGSDTYGQVDSWQHVVAYLRTVDAGLATTAETEYACIGNNPLTRTCTAEATRVHDAMAAAEATLIARSSRHAFHTALYNARMVILGQDYLSGRDAAMASNVTWVRENFSTSGRVVFWAHNSHVARIPMEFSNGKSSGEFLSQAYGDDYFVIGTMTGSGSFIQWNTVRGQLVDQTVTWGSLGSEQHESYLRQRGSLPYLLPLRGTLPEWLNVPRVLNLSAAGTAISTQPELLPAVFDAVIYIDRTTPMHLLR
ncbi:MAG TPA: erythromycin esterase family protein [Thermoanaerobaculia bacterium]|jgi:erythromycin esterase